VYDEDADVKEVEPNFRIKNGETIHQAIMRGAVHQQYEEYLEDEELDT
jgi:hypothetical protein